MKDSQTTAPAAQECLKKLGESFEMAMAKHDLEGLILLFQGCHGSCFRGLKSEKA